MESHSPHILSVILMSQRPCWSFSKIILEVKNNLKKFKVLPKYSLLLLLLRGIRCTSLFEVSFPFWTLCGRWVCIFYRSCWGHAFYFSVPGCSSLGCLALGQLMKCSLLGLKMLRSDQGDLVNVTPVIFATENVLSLQITLQRPLDELKFLEAINYKYRFFLACICFKEVFFMKIMSFLSKQNMLRQNTFIFSGQRKHVEYHL